MRKIICPKCGEISRYGLLEKCHQTLLFDAEGNPDGATELYSDHTGKPRCLRCGRMVKIGEEGDEDAGRN